jgi:hypothetical protein
VILLGDGMNHVPKQQWMGCAVATAAMLAGRSYKDVAAHWPDMDEARMRSPRELCALLEAVTDQEWYLAPCRHQPRVHEFLPPQWPVAVWIQDATFHPEFAQWIVIKGKLVYDPGEWTEQHMSSYPRRDWRVTLVVQSEPPEEFIRIRDRKQSQNGVK